MNPRTSAQALAAVTSALLQDHDVTGLLARLVQDSARFVPADAAGLLLRSENDQLEFLSATSHRTTELELYQAQRDEVPCVDESDLLGNLRRALEGRVVVEQAKGVLAYQLDIDMAAAYDELLRRSERDGTSLTAAAAATIDEARRH